MNSKSIKFIILTFALPLAVAGCVVAPAPIRVVAPPNVVAPPGVVYVGPAYALPGPGYVWVHHPRFGWGWHHPHAGWHRGW